VPSFQGEAVMGTQPGPTAARQGWLKSACWLSSSLSHGLGLSGGLHASLLLATKCDSHGSVAVEVFENW